MCLPFALSLSKGAALPVQSEQWLFVIGENGDNFSAQNLSRFPPSVR
jgi:hypothetical protein